MLNIAICEDDKYSSTVVENALINNFVDLKLNLDIFESPEKLLKTRISHYQIFILDIELGDISGIEVAEQIRKQNNNVIILFLTSHKEYMDKIFHVQTFDYLVKPLDEKRFCDSLRRAIKLIETEKIYFSFSYNHCYYNLPMKEIIFFEKNGRKVLIHTRTQTYTPLMSTKEIKKEIPDYFIQAHSSYIFNVNYFYKLEGTTITLVVNEMTFDDIPVSRKFKTNLKQNIFQKLRIINGY